MKRGYQGGWGDAVVERVAADLRAAFPDTRGFLVVNLWRMKQIYLDYTAPEFLSQAVRELKIESAGPRKLSQAVRESGTAQGDTTEIEFLAQAVRELVTSIPWDITPIFSADWPILPPVLYYLRATDRFGWSRNVQNQLDKSRGITSARSRKARPTIFLPPALTKPHC